MFLLHDDRIKSSGKACDNVDVMQKNDTLRFFSSKKRQSMLFNTVIQRMTTAITTGAIIAPADTSSADVVDQFHMFYHSHETLIIGCVTYAASLLLLNRLDSITGPNQFITMTPTELTKDDREITWITPTTVDHFRKIPSIQELQLGAQIIGVKNGVLQLITLNQKPVRSGIFEKHQEWSLYYNQTVYIFKKRLYSN